jgi:hypothetical protein
VHAVQGHYLTAQAYSSLVYGMSSPHLSTERVYPSLNQSNVHACITRTEHLGIEAPAVPPPCCAHAPGLTTSPIFLFGASAPLVGPHVLAPAQSKPASHSTGARFYELRLLLLRVLY